MKNKNSFLKSQYFAEEKPKSINELAEVKLLVDAVESAKFIIKKMCAVY